MMCEIKATSQYKRDLKHYKHDAGLLDELTGVISNLSADIPLDEKYRDHDLHGNWEGCRECHVRPDALLVYSKSDGVLQVLLLQRFGSHSSLFG